MDNKVILLVIVVLIVLFLLWLGNNSSGTLKNMKNKLLSFLVKGNTKEVNSDPLPNKKQIAKKPVVRQQKITKNENTLGKFANFQEIVTPQENYMEKYGVTKEEYEVMLENMKKKSVPEKREIVKNPNLIMNKTELADDKIRQSIFIPTQKENLTYNYYKDQYGKKEEVVQTKGVLGNKGNKTMVDELSRKLYRN